MHLYRLNHQQLININQTKFIMKVLNNLII